MVTGPRSIATTREKHHYAATYLQADFRYHFQYDITFWLTLSFTVAKIRYYHTLLLQTRIDANISGAMLLSRGLIKCQPSINEGRQNISAQDTSVLHFILTHEIDDAVSLGLILLYLCDDDDRCQYFDSKAYSPARLASAPKMPSAKQKCMRLIFRLVIAELISRR